MYLSIYPLYPDLFWSTFKNWCHSWNLQLSKCINKRLWITVNSVLRSFRKQCVINKHKIPSSQDFLESFKGILSSYFCLTKHHFYHRRCLSFVVLHSLPLSHWTTSCSYLTRVFFLRNSLALGEFEYWYFCLVLPHAFSFFSALLFFWRKLN